MLLGLRGVGKTVLLKDLHDAAKSKGFETILIEAPEGGQLATDLVPELRRVLRRLDRREAAEETLSVAAGALRNFASVFKVGFAGVDFEVTPEPIADSGELERDLPDLLSAAATTAQKRGHCIGLFIDEVQYLSKPELSALVRSCRLATQQGLPLIFVGAGLPQIAKLAGDAKSYAERLFDYPEVGALAPNDAAAALSEPAEKEGVTFEPGALDRIYDLTHRYPYLLRIWGKYAWDEADEGERTITLADVDRVHSDILDYLDANFFRARFDRLSRTEQHYLRAMAQLGPGPHQTGPIAQVLGATSDRFGSLRRKLIALGMIYSQRHGETAFSVPLFDEFMRRAMPGFEPNLI